VQCSAAQCSPALLCSPAKYVISAPAWSFVNEIIEGFASTFVMNHTKLSAMETNTK
jgi:hypothetical protein